MDGLSLAASVIAVIQLAGLCLKLSRKWLGPSKFDSSDLTAMTTALYGFNGAMRNFQIHLEIYEDDEVRLSSFEYLKPALEQCEGALHAIKDFMERGGFIGKHLLAPKFDRKLRASLKALDRAEKLFQLALHADQHTILLGVERYIRNVAEDVRDVHAVIMNNKNTLDELNEDQKTRVLLEERRIILDWLTPIDYAPLQNDLIARRQAGTGQWLLDSVEYQTWVETSGQTLFCPGIPGAGKTIITSIVVDYLSARFRSDRGTGIAYIYCNLHRRGEQKVDNLLASLLKQLAESLPCLPESVKYLYDHHKARGTRPTFDDISRTLQSVVAIYSRLFIIVDALDECQAYHDCRARFLSELSSLRSRHETHIFATSRFIPEITDQFKACVSLEIRARSEDVERYLEGHMRQLPSFVRRNEKLQGEIKASVSETVDGMFLLAQIYLDSLVDKPTPKAIRNALTEFRRQRPGSSENNKLQVLTQAYEQAMERIQGQKPGLWDLAKQVLSWITCAKRPLTISELQHALAVEVDEPELDEDNVPQIEEMVSVCAGLVTVDEQSNVIRLVHYTTQEYLERTQKNWFSDAEAVIATTCVTYLSFRLFGSGSCKTDDEFEERLRWYPLYDYAAHNWGHHARVALTKPKPLILSFLENEAKVSSSAQAMMSSKYFRRHVNNLIVRTQMTGVHLAAYFGLRDMTLALLKNRSGADIKDSNGLTPLWWAAGEGHEAVVSLLLENGADPDSKNSDGLTPLSWAAVRGNESVVRLLLENGANVNSKDSDRRPPLWWASLMGPEAVVKLLLERGADPDSKDSDGRTPLSWASLIGRKAVVKLLLENGADPDSKNGLLLPIYCQEWRTPGPVVKLPHTSLPLAYIFAQHLLSDLVSPSTPSFRLEISLGPASRQA